MSILVSIEELKIATGYNNVSAVENCLKRNGVPFLYGKKGYIFTTRDAINCALGISPDSTENKKFEKIVFD